MTININDLTFETIIGILDFERLTPQKVIVDITIEYDYIPGDFINYADVAQMTQNLFLEQKFYLLEDALDILSRNLKKNFQKIHHLKITITKPSIMPNCRVSVSNFYTFDS